MAQTAFPALSEAHWRRAAEAALKGGGLDKLVSITADGLSLGPLDPPRAGPRAFRAEPGPWKAMSRLDHPSADDFAAQAREDLENGADGLSIVFAGAGVAYGFGLSRWDSASLHRAFDGVALDARPRLRLDIASFDQAEAFADWAERTGAELAAIDIAFGLDPLGGRARSGAPPAADLESLARTAAAFRKRGFAGPCAAADARAVHDAGGTPAQELAFALGAGLAYLRALEDPRQIEFRLAGDADQIATLAKFRALRLLWRRVEAACGLDPAPIRLAASSAWRMMSAVEPFVNVMRATLAAFGAGLGGADDVTLLPFSQPIGLPDAFARRLARNTQLIELREARLGFVADPAAGAGGFEALTEGLCEKAWGLFQAFEAAGGLEKALQQGLVQQAVSASAATLMRDVARAKAPLTGVSAHAAPDSEPIAVLPDVANPVAAGPGALVALRLSEPFERLREAGGAAPNMFLATIGPLAAHSRRLSFAREVFAAGGIAAVAGAGADTAEALAQEFRASGATLACLCGTDEAYKEHAEIFAAALKQAGAGAVFLAGRPGERTAGVDGFIFAGCDLVAALQQAQRGAGLSRAGSP